MESKRVLKKNSLRFEIVIYPLPNAHHQIMRTTMQIAPFRFTAIPITKMNDIETSQARHLLKCQEFGS